MKARKFTQREIVEIKEWFCYNPSTGELTWRKTKGKRALAGTVAGCGANSAGNVQIKFNGRMLKAHRIAWILQTGKNPEGEIDHINRNRLDNRWSNLRVATHAENMKNVGVRKDNKSGVRGVSWCKPRKKWYARVYADNDLFSEFFDCKDKAASWAEETRKKLHGRFAA